MVMFGHKLISTPRYSNKEFVTIQKTLDGAIARGVSVGNLRRFFINYANEQYKLINPVDLQDIQPESLVSTVLKPRQDLYRFILTNWIKHIFLPELGPHIVQNILIFGIGRIFSTYSDMGVQYCTDADLNFVVKDTLSAADLDRIKSAINTLKKQMQEYFNILVEVDGSFTVLKVKQIKARLQSSNPETKLITNLFYKSNADSLFVIHDNPALRSAIFAPLKRLSDAFLFANFLGDNPAKPTYVRLKSDTVKLPIMSDTTQEVAFVESLIGSNCFERMRRHLSGIHPGLFPQEWYHSLKYNVNRVYDYVSAMRARGYALTDLGFTGPRDFDYQFLCAYHQWMLYFQEVIHLHYDTFNRLSDYSYISAGRFDDFMSLPKNGFREAFERMALHGHFLNTNQQTQYQRLAQYIKEHQSLELFLTNGEINTLRKLGFATLERADSGSGKTKVRIPYRYRDLGFLVFDSTNRRLSSIIEKKLLPAHLYLSH